MPNINKADPAEYDIYTEAGIAAGTPVLVQNQGGVTVFIRENTTDRGYALLPFSERECTGSAVLLVRGLTGLQLFVQAIS